MLFLNLVNLPRFAISLSETGNPMRTKIIQETLAGFTRPNQSRGSHVRTGSIAHARCVLQYFRRLLFRPATLMVCACLTVISTVSGGPPGSLDVAFDSTPGITSSSIAQINVVLPQPDDSRRFLQTVRLQAALSGLTRIPHQPTFGSIASPRCLDQKVRHKPSRLPIPQAKPRTNHNTLKAKP